MNKSETLRWLVNVNRLIHEIREKTYRALEHIGNEVALSLLREDLKLKAEQLKSLLSDDIFRQSRLADLRRHIGFGEEHDFRDILKNDLPDIEAKIESFILAGHGIRGDVDFASLLNEKISRAALNHYLDGHYKNAVIDAVTQVFDEIRRKSGLLIDGKALTDRAFQTATPAIILGDLQTDTGKNTQQGYQSLCNGIYGAFRNAYSHSNDHDITEKKAAQILITCSTIIDKLDEIR